MNAFNIFKTAIITAIATLTISACNGEQDAVRQNILSEAELVILNQQGNDIEVRILNPWKENSVLSSLTLTATGQTDFRYKSSGGTVHIPVKRAIVMNNSHCHLISELGAAGSIVGVCESEYIADPVIRTGLADGTITDCGNSMYPDIEKIISLQPDAILVSPFEESGYGQLENLGIPLIECADYMESTPLGRAEWMRFYGLLFGVQEKADSLFETVSNQYARLRASASSTTERPLVMLDTKGGSAWYMAGGRSTIGQMLADAGASYILSDNTSEGSVPLSFETVYERGAESDFWLLKNSTHSELTYDLLAEDSESYTHFKPFRERRIYVCDVYSVPYFEQTAFHPELLLKDFVAILHPDSTISPLFYHPMR